MWKEILGFKNIITFSNMIVQSVLDRNLLSDRENYRSTAYLVHTIYGIT
jgi:hypothetical protein